MSTIRIEKYNEVFVRIFSEKSIEQELSDFFSFRVPGYQYQPLYKNKLWDGYKRLYSIQTKTLYLGLIDYVFEFAKRNNYECVLVNEPNTVTPITVDQVWGFAKDLNLYARGKPIAIRDYQIDAIYNAIHKNKILLISPTSSGKSLIIYTTLRYHMTYRRKCLIVVPSTQLVEQLYSDFEDYSSANTFSVDTHIQKLYSGFSKQFTKDVMITTWQSIVNQPKQFFNQFDVIFGDESHLFAAKSLTSIMERLVDVKYRIGTTGTLDGTKVNKLVLEGIFGREYKVISTKELMDNKSVVELKISGIVLKYSKETCNALKAYSYQDEMDWLVRNPARNKFIRNLALSTNGNTLVLFQYVQKHGKVLYDLIKSRVKDDRKVFFIHGGIDGIDREEVRKICEKENNAIIVASFGTMSTGTNIPSIENVIFASSYKSKIKILQSIGRGLRLNEGKSFCRIFDITDDLSYKKKRNHTYTHAIERYKLYAQEQFKLKITEVNLDE